MAESYDQLVALAEQAGFGPNVAPTMAAIALAESSGNPNALNGTDNHGTQSSYGLWQISTGTHAAPDPNWADPATNARLAFGKYQTQGLRAWGTYTSGAYKKYLGAGGGTILGSDAPGGAIGSSGIGASGNATNQASSGGLFSSLAGAAELVSGAAKAVTFLTLPGTWVRICSGVVGVILVIFGVHTLVKDIRNG